MSENDINIAESILGYLEWYYKKDLLPPHFMGAVIEEATEWIDTAKEALSNQDASKLAETDDANPNLEDTK